MKTSVKPTPLQGLLQVEIEYFTDERGFFIEPWHKRDFAKAGLKIEFVQEGHSRSIKGVLRGLHYQNLTAPMAKLVRCTLGEVFEVAVDLRVKSPTFGSWYGLKLTARKKMELFVPVGFALGFYTLSKYAEVQYKQTGYYTPHAEGTLRWDDPDVGIAWPISGKPILSERDQQGQRLSSYRKHPAFE